MKALESQIEHEAPAVAGAKRHSESLKAEALALQERLIATAAKVVDLESEKASLDAEIARLSQENERLSASFKRDRRSVVTLLAILERMQLDVPPAIVLKADDALGAARSAMLVGSSVPNLYKAAAELARRIDAIHETRVQLIARRAESVRNAITLRAARKELDRLLAMKQLEADAAANRYGDLAARLDKAAGEAADLKALLEKVAALRSRPAQKDIVVVEAGKGGPSGGLELHSLLRPVVGTLAPGGMEGVGGPRAPGLTFAVSPGATVIAPADSEVLFAGPYHKTGQVLILELTAGYDLVLAGLGRVDVRPNDEVLAGEPVGTMPESGRDLKFYFELRHNGRGVSPGPWLTAESRKARRK
ncbi:MAG TPA: peptidoglycan DD-metalloendopeptidase family protein [Rhizomicrobium sp.]|nr:peptidoglycan DD-metalloendopeptidase family protein [Rhizomicrobium sp.]